MNPEPLHLTLMLVLALGHLAFVLAARVALGLADRLRALVVGHADHGEGAAPAAGPDKEGGNMELADAASERDLAVPAWRARLPSRARRRIAISSPRDGERSAPRATGNASDFRHVN